MEFDRYVEINAAYFEKHPLDPTVMRFAHPPRLQFDSEEFGRLRVAIVGTGPAAMYTAQELLSYSGVEVDMFDRLPTPFGLIRAGVAPDHLETKKFSDAFGPMFNKPTLGLHLNVEIGNHLTHSDLRAHHHAVIYAVGASADRKLGIPGEELPGCVSATEFVAWYNGHPDFSANTYDLSGERAVIVGNGNVALDVARILTTPPDELASTDIADHALDALRASKIREVIILGRRGPAQAAYTLPEFLGLGDTPGVDVTIDPADLQLDETTLEYLRGEAEPWVRQKVEIARKYSTNVPNDSRRRIHLRYLTAPVEIVGDDHVSGLRVARTRLVGAGAAAEITDVTETLDTTLVLRAVGYRGAEIPEVPFDASKNVIPNTVGRVDDCEGVYTVGWIKRGPRGSLGTNRGDAAETVAALIEDVNAGRCNRAVLPRAELRKLVLSRQPEALDYAGWRIIDAAETARGRESGRPRRKFATRAELLAAVRDAADHE
ncbi:ferredoxin [Hoyosella rhizosphaerae]|uniref:ferredoxin--NADP(+) reductase n=1 Tax=Hoyosella rhizosphaerae TaxID=1755582 RepID=A0A916UKT3_9ACTN|nr:ferredoxin [Hoyosella rhizosphaerae]